MLPPIVERELRVALLHRKARRQWLGVALVAGAMTLWSLMVNALGASRSDGSALFRLLFGLACVGIVSGAFTLTADLFSEERRNGTLGLLVLTGLTPLEIFTNKLAGALILASYGLFAALPFFALPFLMGGIPPEQFACALVFLVNGLLFCVAIGLLTSVLHRDGGQAQATAVATTAALCLLPPLGYYAGKAIPVADRWLPASPAYAAYLVFGSFTPGSAHAFWLTSAITLFYSVLALAAAALILQRTWRDGPEVLAPKRWRDFYRKWAGADTRWKRVFGTNPFCWLAARERGPVAAAQVFLVAVVLFWFGLYLTGSGHWRNGAHAILTSAVLHLGLNWILAYAAAKRLGEERQSGGFEILLTTPLSARDIVEGQLQGLPIQFRAVAALVVLLDLGLMYSGFAGQDWEGPLIVAYCLGWALVLWFWFAVHIETVHRAMWIGAWTGRPGYAALQSMRGYFWVLVWLTIPLYAGGVCLGFLLVPVVALSGFGNRKLLRQKLIYELRAIAAAPIPAKGDKNFKGWNPRRIYPPGLWGHFDWQRNKPWKRPGRESLE